MRRMIRPEYFLDHWRSVREDAALALEQMPAGKLNFRPQDDLMSFREAAVHILDVGLALPGLLLDGETDFTAPDFREKLGRYTSSLPAGASAAELAAELRSSVRETSDSLAAAPPEFFSGMVTKWDGARLTRLEMLQFVVEHELTHRMQLFLYLRLNGVTPPTTQRKQARK